MKKLMLATIILGVCFGLTSLTGGLLFGFGVVGLSSKAFLAIFIVIELLLLLSFLLLSFIVNNIRKENKKTELQAAIEKDRQLQLLSLYKRFGIPPQRNKNGDLMNFYELLGIEPQFDEFGERVPTVYELLGILPRFNEFGAEIPNVLFIKNKASKICINVPENLKHLQSSNKENNSDLVNQNQNKLPAKFAVNNPKKTASAKSAKKGGSSSSAGKFLGMITSSSKAKTNLLDLKLLNEMFSGDVKPDAPAKPEVENKVEEKPKVENQSSEEKVDVESSEVKTEQKESDNIDINEFSLIEGSEELYDFRVEIPASNIVQQGDKSLAESENQRNR